MRIKRALVVASHPDDELLGCGGVMSLLKNEVAFKVIFIAEGSTCRYSNPESFEAKASIDQRKSFALSALDSLGIQDVVFKDLPCGRLDQIPLIEINKVIEDSIHSFYPDTVFTHSSCDSNHDHVKVHQATIIACRPGLNSVKNLLAYEVLSSSEWGFKTAFMPSVFYPLTKFNVESKFKAMMFYESEIKASPFPRSREGIFTLAAYRGLQSGNHYAEAFELIRSIIQ